MNKNLKIILFITAVIGLSMVLLYSFMLWPWGDDMAYRFSLKHRLFFDSTLNEGLKFDARLLTPIAFFRNFIYKFVSHGLAIFSYVIVFYLSTFLIFNYIIKTAFNDWIDKFIFYSFFTQIIFYSLNFITSEILFWEAGGYYTLNLLVGLLWMICFDKISNFDKPNNKFFALYILLSILAGTLTYNITIALMSYAIIKYILNDIKNIKISAFGFLLLTCAAIILIFSPGALQRTAYNNLDLFHKIMGVMVAFIQVPATYADYSLKLILLMILYTFTYYIYSPDNQYITISSSGYRSVINYFCFAILAFSTIAPFLIARHLASPRTATYFIIFITIFIFNFYIDIYNKIIALKTPSKNLSGTFILFFFIYHIFSFSNHYYVAYDLRKQHIERDTLLRSEAAKKSKFVELKPYFFQYDTFSLYSLKNAEPTDNPKNFQNDHYQLVYGIDTIIIRNDLDMRPPQRDACPPR